MAISLQGIRIKDVSVSHDKDTGGHKITGSYELVSSTGRVLATQAFNGYNDIKITPSGETAHALTKLVEGLTRDLTLTLGLETP